MNAVECDGLIKKYRSKTALDGLSVGIEENRITGLIGRNGAGKTTFLKLAAGFLRPSGGSVRVYGENPFNSIRISNISIYVDEDMAFPTSLTLGEILREMPRLYKNFDLGLAQRLLDYYALDKRQRTARLSKGLRSIFNSVVGISARCPVTIMDEPTAGMDSSARKDFYRTVLKEYMEFPRTIIISSHLLGELTGLLEDIVLIDNGKLSAAMSMEEAGAFAAGLRGSARAVEAAAQGREVLHREEFAMGQIYIAVKGALGEKEASAAALNGVEVLPVAADDLCIYLTQKDKGGIDNVLRQ